MMRAFAKCVMGLSLMSGASCGPRFRSTDSRDGLREKWATASTLLLSSHPCDASQPCRACCIETLCCFGRADRQEDAASGFQATACGKHDNPVDCLPVRAPPFIGGAGADQRQATASCLAGVLCYHRKFQIARFTTAPRQHDYCSEKISEPVSLFVRPSCRTCRRATEHGEPHGRRALPLLPRFLCAPSGWYALRACR